MIRVYLFRGKHPLYQTLVSNPPDGIEYLPKQKSAGIEEYRLYSPSYSLLRRASDGVYDFLDVPRCVPVLRGYDLVHSSRGFFVLGPNRYVVDVEHVASFVGMQHRRLASERARKLIRKFLLSEKCRKVLPHCEAARSSIAGLLNERAILDKMTVVYPSIDVNLHSSPKVSHDVPEILFIGEYYWKGGREVIEACRRLTKKHDFKLTFISIRVHAPPRAIERAKGEMNLEYVEGPIPRQELFERIYPRADIFAMPTYLDTFGYAFLEAMAYGLPCVGASHFAVPEIIENGVSGYLVNPPIRFFDSRGVGHPELSVESVDGTSTALELSVCLERLLDSRTLRERMGSEGKHAVTSGKFSIASRNALLKEVYESSIVHETA